MGLDWSGFLSQEMAWWKSLAAQGTEKAKVGNRVSVVNRGFGEGEWGDLSGDSVWKWACLENRERTSNKALMVRYL